MLKQLQKTKDEKGFTIIEVLIVLAIAGLILLIVFLAVPALNRSSRNTQRKNDVAHLGGIIAEWENNNAGTAPTGWTGGTVGPDLTSEKFAIITNPPAAPADETATASPTAATTVDTVLVYYGATCNGNTLVGKQSKRTIAISYVLEVAGGGTPVAQCSTV